MGSDGSLGIKSIKEQRGFVLVQEPATAKFDSMPLHATQAILVDIVAPRRITRKTDCTFEHTVVIENESSIDSKTELVSRNYHLTSRRDRS
jgi:two-component system CheB/CheR fusion protein